MSDLIKFNTEEVVKSGSYVKPIDIFALVNEDDPILWEGTKEFDFENPPVNPNEFASTLVETCKAKSGFGLAAPQCGFNYRVFVMGAGDEYIACYNPSIIAETSERSMIAEGCLSFPMLALKVSRPKSIQVEYYDFNGVKHEAKFENLSSHIFQHEMDHLNGITYLSKAKPLALKYGLNKRKKFHTLVDRYNKAQKHKENLLKISP